MIKSNNRRAPFRECRVLENRILPLFDGSLPVLPPLQSQSAQGVCCVVGEETSITSGIHTQLLENVKIWMRIYRSWKLLSGLKSLARPWPGPGRPGPGLLGPGRHLSQTFKPWWEIKSRHDFFLFLFVSVKLYEWIRCIKKRSIERKILEFWKSCIFP